MKLTPAGVRRTHSERMPYEIRREGNCTYKSYRIWYAFDTVDEKGRIFTWNQAMTLIDVHCYGDDYNV